MIISRLLYFFFRVAEFISSVVVLGLTAYFVHRWRESRVGPIGRVIYTLVIACLSTLMSIIWLIPSTYNMLNYPGDLFFSAAWFAAFGLLYIHLRNIGCGDGFNWGGITDGGMCNQWKAAQAFSFIAAIFFFASFLLGIWVYHKLRKQQARVAAAPRRGFFGRRARV